MESSSPVPVADPASSSGLLVWLRRHPVFPLLLACAGSSLLSVVLMAVRKLISRLRVALLYPLLPAGIRSRRTAGIAIYEVA